MGSIVNLMKSRTIALYLGVLAESRIYWMKLLQIEDCGCDDTSTNAPDPIRTPQLGVLGRE